MEEQGTTSSFCSGLSHSELPNQISRFTGELKDDFFETMGKVRSCNYFKNKDIFNFDSFCWAAHVLLLQGIEVDVDDEDMPLLQACGLLAERGTGSTDSILLVCLSPHLWQCDIVSDVQPAFHVSAVGMDEPNSEAAAEVEVCVGFFGKYNLRPKHPRLRGPGIDQRDNGSLMVAMGICLSSNSCEEILLAVPDLTDEVMDKLRQLDLR